MKNNIDKAKPIMRSVKIPDALHHKCDLVATKRREGLQDFVALCLERALKFKIYDDNAAVEAKE